LKEILFVDKDCLVTRICAHWGLVIDAVPYVPLLPAVCHVKRIAETKFRPAFDPVVKVTIYKSLGLVFRLAADLDYIMRIHSLHLSLLTLH
jgi:hypothetical protein